MNTSKHSMKKIKLIPIEIKIYIFFCIIVFLLSRILPTFSRDTWEKFIPLTGWSVGSPYMSSLSFVIFLFLEKNHYRFNMYKIMASVLLILYIQHGIQEIRNYKGISYNNPYLEVSEYRFVWVILIPALWILFFVFSTIVRHFQESKRKHNLIEKTI